MGYQAQWQEWLNEAYELLEKLRKHEKFKGWQLEVRIFDKKLKGEWFTNQHGKMVYFDNILSD